MRHVAVSKQKADSKDDKASNAKSANQSYNPSASVYHPIDDACWKRGDKLVKIYFRRCRNRGNENFL